MNKEKMTGIAIILFGGMISLGHVYIAYGWLGVALILAIIGMSIGLIVISEEQSNGQDINT